MKLFVRVIGPRDGLADVSGPLEAWIETDAKTKGTEHPRAMSGWIEIGAAPSRISVSELGGREIVGQRIEGDIAGSVTLRLTGYKIAPAQQDIVLPLRLGARAVQPVTRASDGRGMVIAAEIR
jgi:hypothetical protein